MYAVYRVYCDAQCDDAVDKPHGVYSRREKGSMVFLECFISFLLLTDNTVFRRLKIRTLEHVDFASGAQGGGTQDTIHRQRAMLCVCHNMVVVH